MAVNDLERLPIDVERGASGGLGFKTTIVTRVSGAEQRNQEWQVAKGAWLVGYGIQERSRFEEVVAFFYARRGRARSFLFRDWSDFQAVAQIVGTTDDPNVFQLQKTYGVVNSYVRLIAAPVPETIKVYRNAVVTPHILGDNGLVTVAAAQPGDSIVASFDFDVPVRFDVDGITVEMASAMAGGIASLPVVEVRL